MVPHRQNPAYRSATSGLPPPGGSPGHTSPVIASVSIVTYPRSERRWAFGRMGLDRPDLAKTPGLGFRRLVGTAQGRSFAWRPDLLRWGLVAAWESEHALDAFLTDSPITRR